MEKNISISLASLLLLLTLNVSTSAQGKEKDYERAMSVSRKLSGKIFNSDIRPSWIGKTDFFLYENVTPSGKEYVIVDAVRLTRRPAFDSKKVAEGLGKA